VQRPGTFRGQCAELCGRNHADMLAKVVAVEPDEFKTWLENKRREIDANNKAAAERRKQETQDTAAGDSPAEDKSPVESETPAQDEGP
jgi:cytochrome c oxidase subunit 2